MPAEYLDFPITLEGIQEASRRLQAHARRTPLLLAPRLGERCNATVAVKAENLQLTGSFKFRGAYNRLSQLDGDQRRRGVVAWSSGNHAQAIAYAGKLLDIPTTIVMPRDAPRIKIDRTSALGSHIQLYDRRTESREAIARRLVRETGATLVPSYDDPDVIAGQGTVGLEVAAQAMECRGRPLDMLLVPCGGGGLSAGCAVALNALSPETGVYTVEPDGFDDTARSLRAGKRESNAGDASSLCDALLAPTPGDLTWPVNRRLLKGGLSVGDDIVLAAMRFAWEELKLVVEPGGAVALAAILHGQVDCRDKFVCVIASGGNVDPDLYCSALR